METTNKKEFSSLRVHRSTSKEMKLVALKLDLTLYQVSEHLFKLFLALSEEDKEQLLRINNKEELLNDSLKTREL